MPHPNRPVDELTPQPEAEPRGQKRVSRWLADRWLLLGLSLLLLVAVIALYYPVHAYPFNAINGGEYVTGNSHIQRMNWTTVHWSLTSFYAANWHPLTWLSHAMDFQLFALNAGGHHLTNLLLHAVNSWLLFWVLWRATGSVGRSFMVAALFALHPINVESVAWISERKNLLSMFFLLLALGAYHWYALKPRVSRYCVVAALFVFGLMAKPQVVTLPFVLLLWDYWPLQRMFPAAKGDAATGGSVPARSFSWLVIEKLPLLAFSAASAVITYRSQEAGGAMGGVVRSYSLAVRIENALVAYLRYLGHAIWPTHLAFFYPHARGMLSVWLDALLIVTVITALAIAKKNRSYLAVGWLWFLGTLVPMIGLVQVGGQAMADRYAYLSFVGLFIAVCWGVADLAEQWHVPRAAIAVAGAVTLLLLAFATHRQLSYWSDDVALWSHTVQVTYKNSGAENVLGETLQRAGRSEEAMAHFRTAAAIDPLLPFPHYHLGIYAEQHGRRRDALERFQKVLELTQSDTGIAAELRSNTLLRMASLYEAMGDFAEAERCVSRASQERQKVLRLAAP
jgi:hypothetical protein